MNIGIILDEISQDFQEAMLMVKKVEIKWVELRVLDGLNVAQLSTKRAREYSRILRSNNLKVCGISSPLLKCYLPGEENKGSVGDQFGFQISDYLSHLSIVDHLMDIAEIFEAPLIRAFTFWKTSEFSSSKIEKIAESMTPLLLKARQRGFVFAIENEPSCYVQTAAQLSLLLDKLSSTNVKALWDPGNAKLVGEGEKEGYEKVKDHLVHVHLKDFKVFDERVEFVIPGEGVVDDAFLIEQLSRSGYKGVISLEPCRGTLEFDELKKTVARLRQLLSMGGDVA